MIFAVFYVLLATNRRYFARSPVDGFVQNLAPRLDSWSVIILGNLRRVNSVWAKLCPFPSTTAVAVKSGWCYCAALWPLHIMWLSFEKVNWSMLDKVLWIKVTTKVTTHTVSTSMYSLTFRVCVRTPPQYGQNGMANAAGASILSRVRGIFAGLRSACGVRWAWRITAGLCHAFLMLPLQHSPCTDCKSAQ